MDRLLARPEDAYAERSELLTRQYELRDLAADFRQDADADRSTADLFAELDALKDQRETLISTRIGFATGKGGNSAPAVSGAWVKLGMDALAGAGLDSLNARIAKLEDLLAHRAAE